MTQSPGWFDFAVASPFAATEWLGLGPFCQPSRAAASRLRKLSPTPATMWAALDTIGTTGARLVSVLVWYHDVISREQLADETPGADPGDLKETIDRLVAAGLVTTRRRVGSL